jgi:hypothetical protein
MSHAQPTSIMSHWHKMFAGMQQSSNEFYSAIEKQLAQHQLKDVKTERVNLSEGGVLSAKREYLQIRRKEHVYHICAAPYGDGFFVSSWLGHIESGFWAMLAGLPVVGFWVRIFKMTMKPMTYYAIDTALMFQSVAHGSVLAALDQVTTAKGLRALPEDERKPVMRDFFSRIGG